MPRDSSLITIGFWTSYKIVSKGTERGEIKLKIKGKVIKDSKIVTLLKNKFP